MESPDDSIRRFYFETRTHDEELVRELIDYAGSPRCCWAPTPRSTWSPRQVEAVRALGVEADVEAAILRVNAARLLALREETLT